MNRNLFFEQLRSAIFGRLNQRHVNGINAILDAWEAGGYTDLRWLAYMMATAYHETGGAMYPVAEWGRGRGKSYGLKRMYNGNPYTKPDRLYYGRGYVQLTWYENYSNMGRVLGLPLLEQPDMALLPGVAASIMMEGMTKGRSLRGDFTGLSLEHYFNLSKEDWLGARKIINGTDRAAAIAAYAKTFYKILLISFA